MNYWILLSHCQFNRFYRYLCGNDNALQYDINICNGAQRYYNEFVNVRFITENSLPSLGNEMPYNYDWIDRNNSNKN